MSVNCTSLGKRISFYRSKSNLSQEALAAKINCSREHIVRIENIIILNWRFMIVNHIHFHLHNVNGHHLIMLC